MVVEHRVGIYVSTDKVVSHSTHLEQQHMHCATLVDILCHQGITSLDVCIGPVHVPRAHGLSASQQNHCIVGQQG